MSLDLSTYTHTSGFKYSPVYATNSYYKDIWTNQMSISVSGVTVFCDHEKAKNVGFGFSKEATEIIHIT